MQLLVVASTLVLLLSVYTAAIPDEQGCLAQGCSTYEQLNTLWCHSDPDKFCQCRPSPSGTWSLQVMPCAPATVYSFRHQVCVHPSMRNELECQDKIIGDQLDICDETPCVTYQDINTLRCHEDTKRFCHCRPLKIQPTVYAPLAMPCGADTTFSYRQQTCTRDEFWQNSCP